MARLQPCPLSRTAPSIDPQALVATHGDRLLRSAYLLCGDQTEAQDLVQETFLQALKSGNKFRGASAIYTWLYGILRNLCQHHLRKQKRIVLEEETVLNQSFQNDPTFAMDRDFCGERLAQALQALSPEHREVIVLRYYEELRIQDIAERTGVSPGTVKSRLFYAVRDLETLLPREMNLFASDDTYKEMAR